MATVPIYLNKDLPQLIGKRVLIVDDNATNRLILVRQTQAWGMLPHEFASPTEALGSIQRGEPFDLGILDMQMPGMDGMMLAEHIQRFRDAHTLPLILLTSLGLQDDVLLGQGRVARQRFASYLAKPLKPSQLYNALLTVIDARPVQVQTPVTALQFDAHLAGRIPLRILLAEDNAINQRVALRMLSRMGYHADVAGNGLEVLNALRRQKYDVVFMDVQMPEMDGFEATERIVAQWEAGQRPRIVAMTANVMQGDRERCLAAGMDDYIGKPIKVEELRTALERCTSVTVDASLAASAESVAEEPPTEDVLDAQTLAQFQEMLGAEETRELIERFLKDVPVALQEMRGKLEPGELSAIERAAHALKSSSALFGAKKFSGLCKELEMIASGRDSAGATRLLSLVESEYVVVAKALAAELAH